MTKTVEKILTHGTQALNNTELVSLLLKSGGKSNSASKDIARKIVSYADVNLGGDLYAAEVRELAEINGVGYASAAAIVSAMELSKRINMQKMYNKRRIRSSEDVAKIFMEELRGEKRECFVAIFLNSKLEMESMETISIGNLDSAPVHPREVFRPAVRRGAAAIIVAHNHPSGDPTPSQQDIEVTERIRLASEVIGIKLLDHTIIGDGRFTSMKAEGYLGGAK